MEISDSYAVVATLYEWMNRVGDAMDTIRAQLPLPGSSQQDSLQVCEARVTDALAQHHSPLSDADVDRTRGAVVSLAHHRSRPFPVLTTAVSVLTNSEPVFVCPPLLSHTRAGLPQSSL